MPEQLNCPICGRFMETLDTESRNQVQTCVRPHDLDNPHIVMVTLLTRPTVPGVAGDLPGQPT